ncbi:dTDP-4-dehydrorhamnose reductase [Pseudomonas sp. F1_0610]|uniref:dTDP-4-dehydrorhamnose reductase n=1 Tax=Pseudomonas sp. F1_0610 TaxID=3114284 RepID=UPI0039C0FF04
MHVLLCGATGQIGQSILQLCPQDWQLTCTHSSTLDISQPNCVEQISEQIKPKLIINAAAYTAVDRAELDTTRAYQVNQLGCRHLAWAAQKLDCPIFHLSTDYVFSGEQTAAYVETDIPQPINVYGASKLAGEQEILNIATKALILRTSWVFSEYGSNFVKTMLRLAQEHELSIINDQYGAPTSALGIAQLLWKLAINYKEQQQLEWGIYHYSGAPYCSWYDFAKVIFQQALAIGLVTQQPQLKAISSSQYPSSARRPSSSSLNMDKLFSLYNVAADNWEEQLVSVLVKLSAENKT